MRRMLLAAALLAAPCAAAPAVPPQPHYTRAQDLSPPLPGGKPDEEFRQAYAGDVVARMVAMPSFSAPYATGIRKTGSGYRIFYLARRQSIAAAVFGRYAAYTSRCDHAIDDDTARRIVAVWRGMLGRVRPKDVLPFGLDGELYDFASMQDGHALQGEAWSPSEGTRAAALMGIADTMTAYCSLGEWWLAPARAGLRVHLRRQLADLEQRLRKEKAK